MSAPTPTRALVHRRTLVTAGVLLLYKFSERLYTWWGARLSLYVGGVTMFLARLLALVEEDLKKKVALSTLSQIGMAVFTLGAGFYGVAFLHLVSHGFFKSLLFLQVGYIMHLFLGQQDSRGFGGAGRGSWVIQTQLFLSLSALCGLFFSRGLVTKD